MFSKKSRVHTSRRLLQKQKVYQYKKKTNSICEVRNRLKRSIFRRKNVKHRVSTL